MDEKKLAARRAYYAANYAAIPGAQSARTARDDSPLTAKEQRTKTYKDLRRCRYGLTHEQYEEHRSRPCALCAAPRAGGKAHAIDHDHSMTGPGSVRGALCVGCNISLGNYEKGRPYGRTKCPAWRFAAQTYLAAHGLRLQVQSFAGLTAS